MRLKTGCVFFERVAGFRGIPDCQQLLAEKGMLR